MSEMARSLAELEAVISLHQRGYVEIGLALTEIKDRGLYKEFGTWEKYCNERWGYVVHHAYRLIKAAKLISESADILKGRTVPPLGQLLQLQKLIPEKCMELLGTLDFANESERTIYDLVESLRVSSPHLIKEVPLGVWNPVIKQCEALAIGQSIRVDVRPGYGYERFRHTLRSSLAANNCTRDFDWGTSEVRGEMAVMVLKKRALDPSEVRILRQRGRKIKSRVREAPAPETESDAVVEIPKAMCRRCGMIGVHATYQECIMALRDRIACLEIERDKLIRGNKSTDWVAGQRKPPVVSGRQPMMTAAAN